MRGSTLLLVDYSYSSSSRRVRRGSNNSGKTGEAQQQEYIWKVEEHSKQEVRKAAAAAQVIYRVVKAAASHTLSSCFSEALCAMFIGVELDQPAGDGYACACPTYCMAEASMTMNRSVFNKRLGLAFTRILPS
jgi:hypothetical protein